MKKEGLKGREDPGRGGKSVAGWCAGSGGDGAFSAESPALPARRSAWLGKGEAGRTGGREEGGRGREEPLRQRGNSQGRTCIFKYSH